MKQYNLYNTLINLFSFTVLAIHKFPWLYWTAFSVICINSFIVILNNQNNKETREFKTIKERNIFMVLDLVSNLIPVIMIGIAFYLLFRSE